MSISILYHNIKTANAIIIQEFTSNYLVFCNLVKELIYLYINSKVSIVLLYKLSVYINMLTKMLWLTYNCCHIHSTVVYSNDYESMKSDLITTILSVKTQYLYTVQPYTAIDNR